MEASKLFGRPWNIVARFKNFEDANNKRKELQNKKELQVKVKKLKNDYVVKIRSTVVEEAKKNRKKSKRKEDNFYKKEGRR
tara:strand:- start:777 stop:1019 length:243 start_codon:yes stop_codon:yes gene_type:complete